MSFRFTYWPHLVSLAALIVIWQAAAGLADSRVLPGPLAVFEALTISAGDGELFRHVGITLARVVVSFTLAMLIGVAIGIAMGRLKTFDRLFDAWLVLFLNLPALVTIILCYVWFGLIEAAAIVAVVLNKIPNVIVTVREGARALDRDYLEMAQSFRIGRVKTLNHVVLPQMFPYLIASARSGLALIWKIVLVVELLGRSDGVGFQLHLFFQLFDVVNILAYTVAFTAVILLIDLGILQPVERRANAWRR
ncbi:MAG: ABC transporter permease [Kiloniellales bacterium]